MEPLKFRCSQLGRLMTSGRSKAEPLGLNAKEYILEELFAQQYGVKKIPFDNKYFSKGIENENVAISIYSDEFKTLYVKNLSRFENDFIKGTPDIVDVENNIVVDTKIAWDLFTFAKAEMSKDYRWQLIGYMWLTGVDEGRLAYCLTDTPQRLVDDEKRKVYWRLGGDNMTDRQNDMYMKACMQIDRNSKFSDLDVHKIRTWDIKLEYSYIDELLTQIELANEYAEEYLYRGTRNN